MAALTLDPVHQAYLLEARQMQALSFIVHIPIVCFAIAFPIMVVLVEWLYLRTGDELYRTLARRWTKVMAALFAIGVITGTILSFEMGLLWPAFTGTFGGVFGLGFAIEGFSFFLEAIFIGIYIYGWDRLSPRRHLLSGIPVITPTAKSATMIRLHRRASVRYSASPVRSQRASAKSTITGNEMPNATRGMCTANESACICRAWCRYC